MRNWFKKASSGFKFSIFDSIELVPEVIWNSINNENNIFLCSDYLRALEKAPPKNMAFKYAILYEDNNPAAIAYFQIISLKAHKMLICGNALLSGEHGFKAVPGMDQSKLTKGISEAIERIRSTVKLNGKVNIILIKDFYTERKPGNNTFTDIGYFEYFAGPNMVVPIRDEWGSFNDYLINMNPKYRRKVSSTIKKGESMTRKSLTFEEIADNKDELYRLYMQVADKAKFKLFVLNPEMLQELKRSLEDRFVLDAYYVEDRIVAYTTRIFNGETMEGYSHGLEYELNKQYDIYQNILIDDIKAGINNGVKKINFGRTSIAMKSSFGAVPLEMEFLMQFKVIVPNHLIKRISSFFFKPKDEHCRNPFS